MPLKGTNLFKARRRQSKVRHCDQKCQNICWRAAIRADTNMSDKQTCDCCSEKGYLQVPIRIQQPTVPCAAGNSGPGMLMKCCALRRILGWGCSQSTVRCGEFWAGDVHEVRTKASNCRSWRIGLAPRGRIYAALGAYACKTMARSCENLTSQNTIYAALLLVGITNK